MTLFLEEILSEEAYDAFFDDTTQFFAVWSMQFEQVVEIDQDGEEESTSPERELRNIWLEDGHSEQLGIWHR